MTTIHTFYHRLYALGHRVHLKTDEAGEIVGREIEVTDPDLAQAYDILMKMREALGMCQQQFEEFARQERDKLGTHLSLVERQQLEWSISRHENIAGSIEHLTRETPAYTSHNWLPIDTAPRTSKPIRVLGKRNDGRAYVESTSWWNVRWAIELMSGYLPPTHWQPLEALPEDY